MKKSSILAIVLVGVFCAVGCSSEQDYGDANKPAPAGVAPPTPAGAAGGTAAPGAPGGTQEMQTPK